MGVDQMGLQMSIGLYDNPSIGVLGLEFLKSRAGKGPIIGLAHFWDRF